MLTTEQINILSESIPVDEISGNELKRGRTRRRTMQEMYGTNLSHVCRDCTHLLRRRYSKNYYKCVLWSVSASAASDIKVGQNAYGKFEMTKEAGT